MAEYYKCVTEESKNSRYYHKFNNLLPWFVNKFKVLFPGSSTAAVSCRAILEEPEKLPTLRDVVLAECEYEHGSRFEDTCRSIALESGAIAKMSLERCNKPPALISIQRIENREAALYRLASGMRHVLNAGGRI